MATQDVVAVNVFPAAELQRRERVTSTSKPGPDGKPIPHVRYTVDIKAEPILHDFGAIEASPRAAEAMKEVLARKTRAIAARASDDTIIRRIAYAKELARGVASAVRRYAGGRTGRTTPHQSDRLFNDSGRLAGGLVVRPNTEEKGFTVNVTANRLDAASFGGGEQALVAMFRRLVDLVPEWAGGRAMLENTEVIEAIAEDRTESIFVAGERGAAAIRQGRYRLYTAILRDAQRVLSLGG